MPIIIKKPKEQNIFEKMEVLFNIFYLNNNRINKNNIKKGCLYIYNIYGNNMCMNFITSTEEQP